MRTLGAVGDEMMLEPRVRRHIDVLRLAAGTKIELFDGKGEWAEAEWLGERALVLTRATRLDEGPRRPRLTLVQALPKGSVSDDIVRMCTELGVASIHFAFTERAVPKLDETRAAKRVGRWERLAHEAARQSERTLVPEIVGPAPLDQVIARTPTEASKHICWARAPSVARAPNPVEEAVVGSVAQRWVAVGPEGGFSHAELELFRDAGYQTLSLGPNVLRVHTAAVAAVAILVRG